MFFIFKLKSILNNIEYNIRYLNMSLTPGSGVRRQDTSGVIEGVSSNTVGRYLAFDFIREEWDTVKEV